MNTPSSDMIAKLPKWAQTYISDLERIAFVSVRTLNEFQDNQTISAIFYDEWVCTGEKQGPSIKRHYIQSSRISVESCGVVASLMAVGKGDSQRYPGIEISYGTSTMSNSMVAVVPRGYQSFQLISKEHMR